MKPSDWADSLRQARTENPGATVQAISTAASVIHHAKRQGQEPKKRKTGKQPPEKVCIKYAYPSELNKKKAKAAKAAPVEAPRRRARGKRRDPGIDVD